MTALDYRLETKVSRETKARLEKLRKEFMNGSGKYLSMSALVSTILDSYLKKLPASEVEEEKNL